MTTARRNAPARPAGTVTEELRFVIAPDTIFDLIWNRRGGSVGAAMLFDAIAADVENGVTSRRAFVSPVTLPLVHAATMKENPGPGGRAVIPNLLRLMQVAPLTQADYALAARALEGMDKFHYVDALQFITCRAVGAQFLVTRRDFRVKRSPVRRRSAAEVVPLFKR